MNEALPMPPLMVTHIKAPVLARDFERSKRFHTDLGRSPDTDA
jgi:hypothetical protein